MFTGDRSGDWLYRALHRVGFANQAASTARDDGLELNDAVVTAAVRCAPPGNKPTPAERSSCRPWLEAEFDLLVNVRVLVALGAFAYQQALRILSDRGLDVPRPRPRFSHAAEVHLRWGTGAPNVHRPFGGHEVTLLCSYHPSQQNTFTGRLTEEMFDAIWRRARELIQS
jgi:uracil-DNA glycosylase family 4